VKDSHPRLGTGVGVKKTRLLQVREPALGGIARKPGGGGLVGKASKAGSVAGENDPAGTGPPPPPLRSSNEISPVKSDSKDGRVGVGSKCLKIGDHRETKNCKRQDLFRRQDGLGTD